MRHLVQAISINLHRKRGVATLLKEISLYLCLEI
ncbi:hypothetical protein PhiH1_205 [Halobacterium phage phiH]|uniref:Uncharacterized protein n=1 Tax=Halobacterium phage phiH TaxID=169684 RepID=A0A3G1ZKX6_BPPHH|nr:hypothetical protein JR051_gp42 [Halobacterium phage phiH]AYM00287.1 hypothetical protein PhiH1_205 [Halobacterium phage phiH]